MAYLSVKNVRIRGISVCVPSKIVENKDYKLIPADQRDRFISTIGIERRRNVEPGVCTSDLCFTAAENLMAKLGWDRGDIELLVFVSQTPDYKMPSTSCILQNRLGLQKTCMAFDISQGCTGYIYGLAAAGSLLSTGSIKKALLMVGNTQSLNTNYLDQSAYPLFGDAGSVTALEYYPENPDRIDLAFGTDGSGEHTIIIPDGGYRNPVTPQSFDLEDCENGIRRTRLNLKMVGDDVFSFVISQVPKLIRSLYEQYSIDPNELDYYLLHQASLFTCESLRKRLKLPEDKVPYILRDFGNSSNASVPLIMVTKLKDEMQNKKLKLLLTGFGVGLSMACGIVTTDSLQCADLVEH